MIRALLLAAIAALTALQLRRAFFELRGRLCAIEALCDEAIGRLSVLTVEAAGGYESEAYAAVGTAGRERIEGATAGVEMAKWN